LLLAASAAPANGAASVLPFLSAVALADALRAAAGASGVVARLPDNAVFLW
jgi:hypothetical protein